MLLTGRQDMSRMLTLWLSLGLASAQPPQNKAGLEAHQPQATPRFDILVKKERTLQLF